MTTNSPNPVDGDVQALIEQCKDNIETLTVAFKHCDQEEADEIYRNLELQKVALAALKAKPGIFEWRFKEIKSGPATGWNTVPMERFEQAKNTFGDIAEFRFWFPGPPAQLLRPVELPMVKTARSNWSTWNWIEHLGGRFQNGNPGDYIEFGSVYAVSQMLKQYRRTVTAEVIAEISESLRQQGFEVKS